MSKLITKKIDEPWFSLIKVGLKTVEGRLNKGDFMSLNKGDILNITNNELGFERKYQIKITSVHKYNTFSEYLEKEKLEKCLPGIDTIEQGVSIYYKYYKKDDEDKYKIIAIRLKVIN
jgi:ASC-1-like (ASCH) protein|tara:strand:+ start:27 stop:380 length:354 start_codon:yes stop_codon:yes gene_type:complete